MNILQWVYDIHNVNGQGVGGGRSLMDKGWGFQDLSPTNPNMADPCETFFKN